MENFLDDRERGVMDSTYDAIINMDEVKEYSSLMQEHHIHEEFKLLQDQIKVVNENEVSKIYLGSQKNKESMMKNTSFFNSFKFSHLSKHQGS